LSKTQKRNAQKRRAAKGLVSAAKIIAERDAVVTSENLKLIKQTRKLTFELDAAKKTADAHAKNADVANVDKKIAQRTVNRLTSLLVTKDEQIKSLKFKVKESAHKERIVSMTRASNFVQMQQDGGSQP
jgi:tellurite resistance protein